MTAANSLFQWFRLRGWRLLAVALFVLLVCLRMPILIRHGRFWAEEGRVYFYNAWTLPWRQAVLHTELGYLNLPANLATLLARHLAPLPDMPHVTTLIALVLQTVPALILVTSRDAWLRRPAVLLAAMLLMAMPPVCEEVWLNTITSQFHLALAAALCLALEVPTGINAAARAMLLLFVPLCSPGSAALAPLFVLRAGAERDRGRAVQAAAIAAGTVLQFALFYTPVPGRGHIIGPFTLISIFAVKHLAIPLLGEATAERVAAPVQASIRQGHVPVLAVLAVLLAGGLLAAGLWRRFQAAPFWLFAAGGALAVLSYFGAFENSVALITVVGNQRYAFAPSVLFALTVLALAATGQDWTSRCAWAVAGWLMCVAAVQTVYADKTVFTHGPAWKAEITQWRRDPAHPIGIWPAGWSMTLPPLPHA